ncbi:ornithine decarboxylase [Mycena olivaceomarginata]|nr:ornithine decarboxylase [Mycena olivaceomarginata]
MSRVETISTSSPVDITVSDVPTLDTRASVGMVMVRRGPLTPWIDNLSSSPTLRLTAGQLPGGNINVDENIFPLLPPLLRGHPDVHLRNGVMNASRSADPDAENAFFVADLSQVYRQHLRWQACLPEIQPFYAVKCNPDPYVLRLLAALGTGFDCASNGEISQILDIGVDPSRIIYANPCKAVSFVRNAGKVGVSCMTFDNEDELYKIARAHPGAQLVFGAALATVPGLLAKAKELNLDVVGVSFHVGSGCYDPSVYTDAVMRLKTAFDMGTEAGYQFSLLDVGGGFEDALFEQAATFLTDAIATYFPDRRGYQVSRLILLRGERPRPTRAPTKEDSEAQPDRPSVMYYINDGVYGAFNCILFDHQTVHPYVLSMGGSFHVASSEPVANSSVWGPTCDSIDCVCPATQLPGALRVGDWLGFDGMGAYTVCAASQFNGFAVSRVIYTTGGFGAAALEVRRELAKFAMADGHVFDL